jgi:hypothetical protein
VTPTAARDGVQNEAGQIYKWHDTIACRLVLLGAGQADLIRQVAAFERALTLQYQDFAVLADDGTVAVQLRNAASLTGVRVTHGPSYPEGDGAEFATRRTVDFTLEADYPAPGAARMLLAFRETVSYSGGLPLVVFAKPLAGRPIKQFVGQDTYRAVQSGQLVSVGPGPFAPSALWPGALVDRDGPNPTSPNFLGRAYEGFGLAWTYRFESADPLPFRNPNVWR